MLCENWLYVAPVFDIERAILDDPHTALVLRVPLRLTLIVLLLGDDGRAVHEVPHLVIRFTRERVLELGGLLAVRVTAATVGSHFTRSKLVPRLRGIQHHAAFVDGLERKADVRGELREEAGVRVTVRVARLLVAVELAERDFAQYAKAFAGVVVVPATGVRALAICGRFHHEDPHRVDVVVGVETGVGTLVVPVQRRAVSVTGERV